MDYVPYGTFDFYPLTIGSECRKQDDYHECEEDKNFTITSIVKCVGGECGDVQIWLDP